MTSKIRRATVAGALAACRLLSGAAGIGVARAQSASSSTSVSQSQSPNARSGSSTDNCPHDDAIGSSSASGTSTTS